MAREFYVAVSTARTKRCYGELKAAAPGLGRVSVLGGWAVHELVEPMVAMESLDVDILIHDSASWTPTVRFLRGQGFVWRRLGRGFDRRFVLPGPHDEAGPAVDVFYTDEVSHDILQHLFGPGWAANIKAMPFTGFVPELPAMVADKVATLPLRPANDPKRKRLKDALDLHALLFHNRAGTPPQDLLPPRVGPCRRALAEVTDAAPYEAEMRDLTTLLAGRRGRP